MGWFELILSVPEPLRESVVNRLFELGAEGVKEEDSLTPPRVTGFFQETQRSHVSVEMGPYLDSLSDLFPGLPRVRMEFRELAQENWSDRYKEFYKAQKLTSLFFLKPAWDKNTEVPSHMIPIVLEPGQAFGTGLHATTRLCISLIQVAVELYARPAMIRLLDVGTGTGILAIVAAKLHVGQVIGIDNDPIATEAARENIILNEVPQIEISDLLLDKISGPFDVIVSNILLETHRELVAHYARLIKPGGQLILSGVLGNQKRQLVDAMKAYGLVEEFSDTLQEWAAVSFSRHSAGVLE